MSRSTPPPTAPASGSRRTPRAPIPPSTWSSPSLLPAIPTDSSPFVLAGVSPSGVVASYMPERRAWLPPPRPSNAAKFDAYLHSPARPWNAPPTVRGTFRPGPAHAAPVVGNLRSFHVCADFVCDSTKTVWARAEAVGVNVAIYIDTLSPLGGPTAGMSATTLDSLLQILDQKIYPIDINTFGAVSDIDSNGVVLALMSPVVNELVTRTDCEQNGFIAGFFFAGDLYPGYAGLYNDGEVYYSVVPDPDSVVSCAHSIATVEELMGSTFAHELEHMINYTQHVLNRPGGQGVEAGMAGRRTRAVRHGARGQVVSAGRYDDLPPIPDVRRPLQRLSVFAGPGGLLPPARRRQRHARRVRSELALRALPGRSVQHRHSELAGLARPIALHRSDEHHRPHQRRKLPDHRHRLGDGELRLGSAGPGVYGPGRAQVHVVVLPSDVRHPPPLRATRSRRAATRSITAWCRPSRSGDQVYLSGMLRSGSGYYVRAMQGPAAQAFALSFTLDGTNALDTTIVPRLDVVRIR